MWKVLWGFAPECWWYTRRFWGSFRKQQSYSKFRSLPRFRPPVLNRGRGGVWAERLAVQCRLGWEFMGHRVLSHQYFPEAWVSPLPGSLPWPLPRPGWEDRCPSQALITVSYNCLLVLRPQTPNCVQPKGRACDLVIFMSLHLQYSLLNE